MNVYPFIEAEKRCRHNVTRACELLKVSRAAFYAWLSGPSQRDQDDTDLAAKIQAVHEESKGRYGAPRVEAELRRRGHRHGRKRVARLMRQAGLQGRAARRWKKTTIPDPAGRPPGRRRVHRLVQRHPAAQQPRLPQPRRIRSHHRKGGPRASSLTSHQPCPSKRGSPTLAADDRGMDFAHRSRAGCRRRSEGSHRGRKRQSPAGHPSCD